MFDDFSFRHLALGHSLLRVGETVLAILHTRLELIETELHEEKLRLVRLGALSVIAIFLLSVGLLLLGLFVIALFWDEHPIKALAVITATFFIGSGACVLVLMRRLKNIRQMIHGWVIELKEQLPQHAKSHTPSPPP